MVKCGVSEAGGFPVEFPVMSLGETLIKPTAMLYRNLASMDVEKSIRVNPVDGVVLLCRCDKTTPSLWKPRHIEYPRGYVHFYQKHVEQAHLGADMDFLKGGSGSEVTRDSH